jgi:hypothetical protein
VRAQLPEDLAQRGFDGALRYLQARGDVAVGEAGSHFEALDTAGANGPALIAAMSRDVNHSWAATAWGRMESENHILKRTFVGV